KQRDPAVTACKEFLQRYGPRLGGHMSLTRLEKPATAEQVPQGQAIFSLDDEGKARVVKLPKMPMEAKGVTLKDYAYKGSFYDVETGKESIHTGYHQSGHVWQAEEVLKDGKWQRYYGFVGSHRVARVTAAEIEFPDDDWYERSTRWVRLSSGVDGHLEGP